MDDETAKAGFENALSLLVNANSQDNTKGDLVTKWFSDYFGETGKGHYISQRKQSGNRVTEQTRHTPNHIVSVCADSEILGSMRDQFRKEKNQYSELHAIILVLWTGTAFLVKEVLVSNECDAVRFFQRVYSPYERRLSSPTAPGESASSTHTVTDSWTPSFDCLSESPCGLLGLETAYRDSLAALQAGKHVIFYGPPGTGKAQLALCLCETLLASYTLVTATADWTTFDTIGGYFPRLSASADGEGHGLEFSPAVILQAIDSNAWVIIDELNRADIDKAFGELFTTLAGAKVRLPYQINDEGSIKRAVIHHEADPVLEDEYPFTVSSDWRILGTMNTFDKSSLFQLSFAFMRRFSFVPVDIPLTETYQGLIKDSISSNALNNHLNSNGVSYVENVLCGLFCPEDSSGLLSLGIEIGPAIPLDIVKHIAHRAALMGLRSLNEQESPSIVLDALEMYLYPQFEGRDHDHEAILDVIGKTMELGEEALRDTATRLSTWTGAALLNR